MIMNMILKDLDEVYQKDEELRQQERSRSRMQSEERFPFSKTWSKWSRPHQERPSW